jgi:endo-alpha-1,4-polygalactosaminidase (GH114 family)
MSNFREKLEIGQRLGEIKAILWHQGESDANAKKLPFYKEKLARLIREFRTCAKNENLPVLIGELGSYSKDNEYWQKINQTIRDYSAHDRRTAVISTSDLKDKGDTVHFNSVGQRIMGQRFAIAYLKLK